MSEFPHLSGLSRRQLLQTAACGFGSLALSAMCCEQSLASNALAAKPSHFRPRAKRVIFLFMQGGPSHVDLFDYKPRLARENGNPLPFDLPETEATVGLEETRLLGPVSKFSRQGECGLLMTDLLPHLAQHADDLCILRATESDSPSHPVATKLLHTGTINKFWPSMGAWISYGLGTDNQQLPSYITILPEEGERNYSSAFLPAIHQATPFQEVGVTPGRPPIRHLSDPSMTQDLQRRRINLIQAINRRQIDRLEQDQNMEGLIECFELAFRMQTEAPKLVNLSNESQATLDLYGIGQEPTNRFGRQCLLARRFAEAGVRFIQVSLRGWDQHGRIRANMPKQCAISDKPIAGLLSDLKSRGLLDDTLVLWAGEFGRTPFSQDLNGDKSTVGREHNPRGFATWMAGGGIRGGITHGETDEYGYRGVNNKVHIHDLHATILYLLGLDHERLTFRHAGRDFRLTDVSGQVVQELIA